MCAGGDLFLRPGFRSMPRWSWTFWLRLCRRGYRSVVPWRWSARPCRTRRSTVRRIPPGVRGVGTWRVGTGRVRGRDVGTCRVGIGGVDTGRVGAGHGGIWWEEVWRAGVRRVWVWRVRRRWARRRRVWSRDVGQCVPRWLCTERTVVGTGGRRDPSPSAPHSGRPGAPSRWAPNWSMPGHRRCRRRSSRSRE